MKLWVKILIGLAAGVAAGAILGSKSELLKPLGTIFLSMINMLVMLLVFSSMTVGITSFNDPKKLGRIGLKTLLLYIVTTMIAIVLGLSFAYLIEPGNGVGLTLAKEVTVREVPSLGATFLDMVPSNHIAAFSKGN
jgi:DAACS family dicarboxylate/amino acid:cation (Na+ or H+) symporter